MMSIHKAENATARLTDESTLRGRALRTHWILSLAIVWFITSSYAAPEAPLPAAEGVTARSLADLSLEELMNTPVTSVSKKETRLHDSPAAIFVVTPEDIRRVGATTIPEALRIVPGMDVARINANEWAVSSRGFNSQYANKLLVLVDGRTVYTPSFSGVFWSMQDLMLEDLDRIEVIRGPGATLWGANAVNGVINIMSKSAKDTQGWLASTIFGTDWQPLSNLRYGGQLQSNLYYRVYGQFLNHHEFERTDGTGMGDDWISGRAGTRLDWHPSERDQLTLQGDYSRARIGQTFHDVHLSPAPIVDFHHRRNRDYSGNVLSRWTRTLSTESEFALQLYYDAFRHGVTDAKEKRQTFDIEWNHRFPIGERHDIVWGLGYRYSPAQYKSSESIIIDPESTHQQLFNGFLQDEISLVEDKLSLTAGLKIEHNDYTAFEFQPNGRLLWTPTDRQAVWTSVARAVRTPGQAEEGARVHLTAFQLGANPVLIAVMPANNVKSEELLAYEIGYRFEPTKRLSFDLAAFYNLYDDLVTYTREGVTGESTPPPFHVLMSRQAENLNHGKAYGVELNAQWQATDCWRLTAGYTWYRQDVRPDESAERASPAHQVHLRSYLNLTEALEFNSALYFVDKTTRSSVTGATDIPAYVRMDLGMTWRPKDWMELAVWGQNLLDNRHPEINSAHTTFITEIPRSVFGKITVRF